MALGILDFTKTNFGRSLLRQWCLRPSLSIPEIEGRHDAVDKFVQGENISTAEAMHAQLKGLKNTPRAFARIKAGKGTVVEWQGLVRVSYEFRAVSPSMNNASLEVRISRVNSPGKCWRSHACSRRTHYREGDAHRRIRCHFPYQLTQILKLQRTVDVTRLKDMGVAINEIIDWESSENERRTCVRPQVDEVLDQQKQVYHGLDNLLSKVALEVKKDVPSGWATSLNVLYFPQLGRSPIARRRGPSPPKMSIRRIPHMRPFEGGMDRSSCLRDDRGLGISGELGATSGT